MDYTTISNAEFTPVATLIAERIEDWLHNCGLTITSEEGKIIDLYDNVEELRRTTIERENLKAFTPAEDIEIPF